MQDNPLAKVVAAKRTDQRIEAANTAVAEAQAEARAERKAANKLRDEVKRLRAAASTKSGVVLGTSLMWQPPASRTRRRRNLPGS